MNHLLKTAATCFLMSATLLVACNKATISPTPADQVKLALNQSARLSSGVTVKIDSLSDSRCPLNVNCIWAGNVMLRAVLTKDADVKTVRLILGQDPRDATNKRPDSTGVVLTGTTYKVVLRDVTPFPVAGVTQRPEAVIEVTPR